jgi:hypothetical protein
MKNKKSLLAYFFSCAFIFSLVVIYPSWDNKGGGATLSWDVMGYYTYLPAGIIYQDLAQLKFREDIQEKYHSTGLDMAAYPTQNGNQIMKYPMGMALAYSPWFLIAHTTATFTSYPADGYSAPYQFFLEFGCLIYVLIGLWYFRKILIRYFDDEVAAITLILIALGTNYLNYSAFDIAMPHNFLFTLYALLTWYTIKWYEKPNFKDSIIIGICIGWAALARPTEVISILIPILWGLSNLKSVRERFFLWKKHFGKLFLTGSIIAVIGSLQIIYWKIFSGNLLEYSYQDQGFSWNGVHLQDTFFSYRKGWLMYTPIMAFSMLGFYFLWKKNNTIPFLQKYFWAVFIFFLINTYIIFSWDIWWYGGGFGQRAMIPSYLLLGLPLAAFLEFIKKHFLAKIGSGIILLGCMSLNLFQTWQAHMPSGGFETENMTKAYYWKIFGKTKFNPEWKILLDTDEEYLGEIKNSKVRYSNNFEQVTDSVSFNSKYTTSDSTALYLSQAVQFSPVFSFPFSADEKADWVRASANFYCESKEWNYWQMTQFIISLEENDQVKKHKMIRVHRLLGEKDWRRISVDIKIPKGQSFNNIKLKFWNAGGSKEIWIDDLKIESFRSGSL